VTSPDALPDHVRRNRVVWDEMASDYVANGERSWALPSGGEDWGVWDIPESQLRLLPGDLIGKDTIELGCGTGYISAWLARRGARPVGIDNSEQQLATARRLQAEHGIEFLLIHCNAETVPLPDASFDLAISEYGASIWADPYRWIPEASRLLRPGGELIFLVNGLILMLCMPDPKRPPRTRCSGHFAASIGSNGRTTIRSTFIWRMATGSRCSGRMALKSSDSSSSIRDRTRARRSHT
jgi:SAM-dependent methyltransferase